MVNLSNVLRKGNRIITKVNSYYHIQPDKLGFEVPKTLTRALQIDKGNDDKRWEIAINKELGKAHVAFKILEDETAVHIGHK